ncbi:glycosyltransferase family 2 protein [Niabella terrae]
MLFDIIIPTYNNLEELKPCLEGLASQELRDFKVWICVDGSTDGTLEYFRSDPVYAFSYQVLQHPGNENRGRAATRNLALGYLKADYVVLLDADLCPRPDFLKRHLEIVQLRQVSVGAVVYAPGGIWRDYLQARGMYRYEARAGLPFQYFESGNAAMATDIFLGSGGFDEKFTGYGGEDLELAARIFQQYHPGFIYNPGATVTGKMNKSLAEGLEQRRVFSGSGLRYIERKHPQLDDIFKLGFLRSPRAGLLYTLLPEKILEKLAELRLLPAPFRCRLVHLLVFAHMYRGYREGGNLLSGSRTLHQP